MAYAMLLLPILVLAATPGHADQLGTTDSGETVVLKDDGTWEYTEEGAKTAAETTGDAFWVHVTTNAAKILVILVALLALRGAIRQVGKAREKRRSS